MPGFTPAAAAAAKDTEIAVSDTLIIQDTTERNTSSTTYTKVAAFMVKTAMVEALCRVVFTLKGGSSSYAAYGRVYLDGVALGTERTVSSTSYSTFTEDLDLKGAGHVVELYLKTASGSIAYTNEFSIKGDESEIALDWEQTYP